MSLTDTQVSRLVLLLQATPVEDLAPCTTCHRRVPADTLSVHAESYTAECEDCVEALYASNVPGYRPALGEGRYVVVLGGSPIAVIDDVAGAVRFAAVHGARLRDRQAGAEYSVEQVRRLDLAGRAIELAESIRAGRGR